jgi:hypothetical protein
MNIAECPNLIDFGGKICDIQKYIVQNIHAMELVKLINNNYLHLRINYF